MFGDYEKTLVFKYSSIVLQVKTGKMPKDEALSMFMSFVQDRHNTDISYANLVNSVQSVIGKDKTSAATAITIFEKIMASEQVGPATKDMLKNTLPLLNVPQYMQNRADKLQALLSSNRTSAPRTASSNPGLNTKYGARCPSPRANRGLNTKYGVGKCFPVKEFDK